LSQVRSTGARIEWGTDMRRLGVVLSLVALVSIASLPAGAASKSLKTELLTLSQLPKGWLSASPSAIELPGCKASAQPAKWTAQATAHFDYRVLEGFPEVNEVLATYKDVTVAFDSLTAGLDGCKHVTAVKHGMKLAVTITSINLKGYGDQSAAYKLSLSAVGSSAVLFSGLMLVIRDGTTLLDLQDSSTSGGVKTGAFESLATTCIKDL
jgi:hypothetical protein